jgi:hypothetical protein
MLTFSTDRARYPVDVKALDAQFADPTNPTFAEIRALADNDPKTPDGRAIYTGLYNADKILGQKLGHAKMFETYSKIDRTSDSLAPTVLHNPSAQAESTNGGLK